MPRRTGTQGSLAPPRPPALGLSCPTPNEPGGCPPQPYPGFRRSRLRVERPDLHLPGAETRGDDGRTSQVGRQPPQDGRFRPEKASGIQGPSKTMPSCLRTVLWHLSAIERFRTGLPGRAHGPVAAPSGRGVSDPVGRRDDRRPPSTRLREPRGGSGGQNPMQLFCRLFRFTL